MTISIFIIIFLIVICIILSIRKKRDYSSWEKRIEILEDDIKNLSDRKDRILNRIDQAQNDLVDKTSECAQVSSKIEEANKLYEEKKLNIENLKKSAQDIYEEKTKALELDYSNKLDEKERQLLEFTEKYKEQIDAMTKDLNSMKATRSAAMEAWRKEQEEKSNKDFYRLDITEQDISDINLLNTIRERFSNPRVISKLIWQTYYQPIAKVKFPMILGDNDVCGIYKITNIDSNLCYIGQAKNVYKRWLDHCKCGCGLDTPSGNKLYKAMIEDGLYKYTFEIIEICEQEYLDKKESYFIDMYSSIKYGYNSQSGNGKE